ncbi:DUF3501 family protein [Marinobacterium rhizophilum]|uniref:DUF3501 family protein n=1 Tax=Marinobacterium rhizophilum TaxID=420402 RepID=A0ABY5HRM7_9GAMM|nr:DUF3501 family protein [Marinobacterium rhizophilum]UTW13877.1 DUF3501 family protein [Marinobacterium rhizophilum]
MNKLTPQDLWPLETYARRRGDFRARVMAHKRDRQLMLGDHLRLLFEDRTTVQYQIQEMLRIEKLFEEAEILDELNAYNPLIPDGSNWKATLMIEIADVPERRRRLQAMVAVEHRVWMQVGTLEPVFAIADEDMERSTDEKTSSVHFLRFELTPAMLSAAAKGRALHAGVDHPACRIGPLEVGDALRRELVSDLVSLTH